MFVLSLFDGISCGRVALERANIKVNKYYASEIDKYAIKVSENNYPDIVRLGDVNNWQSWDIDWSSIDLILAGSPCQSFSMAGKQLAFDDPRGKLFFVFVNILNHVKKLNPNVKFLLENVRMKKEFIEVINNCLGVESSLINSSLVSAQDRKRLYWCNWQITEPKDQGILLKDILLTNQSFLKQRPQENKKVSNSSNHIITIGNINPSGNGINGRVCSIEGKCYTLTTNKGEGIKTGIHRERLLIKLNGLFIDLSKYVVDKKHYSKLFIDDLNKRSIGYINCNHSGNRVHNPNFKAFTLRATCGGGAAKMGQYLFGNYPEDFYIRKLHPIECERLQTLPNNYTQGISDSQRYKCLGNGWTVDIIVHLLRQLFN